MFRIGCDDMRCPRCNAIVDPSATACPECGLQRSKTASRANQDLSNGSTASNIQSSASNASLRSSSIKADKPADPRAPKKDRPAASQKTAADRPSGRADARANAGKPNGLAILGGGKKKPSKKQTLSRIEQKELDAMAKKQNRKRTGVIALILLCVLGVLFLFANSYVNAHYDSWAQMLRVEFGIGRMPIPEKATVEAIQNSDGKAARKITVKGSSPDVLVIKSLENQRVTFVNGEATITVPDSYFIPKEVTSFDTQLSIALEMVILDNRGNEAAVPVDPFTIEIPVAQADSMNPPQDVYQTSDATLTLSMKVSADASVYVNGEKKGENLADGQFSLALPLTMGENTYKVEVRQPFHAVNLHNLVITRVLPAAGITLNTKPPVRTENSTLTVAGKYESGASLKLSSGKGTLSVDKKALTFTFKATLSALGDNSFTITSSKQGLQDGKAEFTVERIPNSTSFAKDAKAADVGAILASPKSSVGKALLFTGTVQGVEGTAVTLSFSTGQTMKFTYKGDTKVAVGDAVKLYGQLLSGDNTTKAYDARAWFLVK